MPACISRFQLVIVMVSLTSLAAMAQSNRYVVHFKDKSGTPFSLNRPEQFLSPKAIARRQKNNVQLTEEDFPVNPAYRSALTSAGATVLFSSRWFNCTMVEASADIRPAIEQLSMVASVELVAPGSTASGRSSSTHKAMEQSTAGAAIRQLSMIGIDQLHADGFTGSGVTIAVMDSGFPGVPTLTAFSALRSGNRIKDSYNFAYNRSDVFGYDAHGENVLSIMAANPGPAFSGSAPDANYLLYVTEFVPTEYRVEEYNWLFAAERADSAGADVINTSLGYFTFDDPAMDYSYASMNGKTTRITRAAEKAAARGIIVVCSAGNEGAGSWKYISAPADGNMVLSVGAVDANGLRAPFSSVGPASDGRTKPDIMAQGAATQFINASGALSAGSGTSFSSPVIAGFVAGLMQAQPELTAAAIISQVRAAGDKASTPNDQYGFGIPTYSTIRNLITGIEDSVEPRIHPNPGPGDRLRISIPVNVAEPLFLSITDLSGKSVHETIAEIQPDTGGVYQADGLNLPAGCYLIRFKLSGKSWNLRWLVR